MMIIILVIIFFVLILAMAGLITYFAIHYAAKANNQYELFAQKYGYQFDKAMVIIGSYRDYSQNTLTLGIKIPNKNPYIDKYANYSSFPFGRGVEKQVAYVIEGNYKSLPFRAFTYQFTGSIIDGGGSGGVFSIVMIQTPDIPKESLPENVFYEHQTLCEYLQGNLEVDTIHPRIEKLIELKGA